MANWHDEGVKAGKTDGWMNVEETLAESLADHPQYSRDPFELIQTATDGWEETDHFGILYGSKIIDDAKDEAGDDEEGWIDIYQDNKGAFWEGYLSGRKSIGRDIYKLAGKLIAQKTRPAKKATKGRAKRKSSRANPNTSFQTMR